MKVYVLVEWDGGYNEISSVVTVCATMDIALREKRERSDTFTIESYTVIAQ